MSIPFSMFGVGDRISDNVLEEDFENAAGLFIYQTRNTLYAATTSKTTNCLSTQECDIRQREGAFTWVKAYRLSDTLYVVAKNLAMAFCSALA